MLASRPDDVVMSEREDSMPRTRSRPGPGQPLPSYPVAIEGPHFEYFDAATDTSFIWDGRFRHQVNVCRGYAGPVIATLPPPDYGSVNLSRDGGDYDRYGPTAFDQTLADFLDVCVRHLIQQARDDVAGTDVGTAPAPPPAGQRPRNRAARQRRAAEFDDVLRQVPVFPFPPRPGSQAAPGVRIEDLHGEERLYAINRARAIEPDWMWCSSSAMTDQECHACAHHATDVLSRTQEGTSDAADHDDPWNTGTAALGDDSVIDTDDWDYDPAEPF